MGATHQYTRYRSHYSFSPNSSSCCSYSSAPIDSMTSLGNNRETAVAVVLGAAVAGSATLLSLYLSKRKIKAARLATLQCSCGKVEVEIFQPAANYKYIETPCLQCCCTDCVSFCLDVLTEGSAEQGFKDAYFDPGIPTVQLYDSEISVRRGSEYLEHMKLSQKTENRRVYARCCGTPIAIAPDHSHLNLVYCPIISPVTAGDNEDTDEVPFPAKILNQPTVCLYTARLGQGFNLEQTRTKHPQMQLVSTVFCPSVIASMLGRLALLLVLGQRGPGQGFPVGQGKTVAIGFESIKRTMAKKE